MKIGRERLRQLLVANDITFQRTKTWKESNDPDRDAKLDRIEHVLEHHPDRTFAFDEFGPLAIRPVGGSRWAPSGGRSAIRRTTTSSGARSDLAPWDSAELARAIARCPLPVWVALGHAQDRTVADMAAHRSHPTPSAAAAALLAGIEATLKDEAEAISTRQHDAELATAQRRMQYATAVAFAAIVVVVLLIWAGVR